MANLQAPTIDADFSRLNVADRLADAARAMPKSVAVVCPRKWSPDSRGLSSGASGAVYSTITFAELDAEASQLARGFADWGVQPGMRLALLVRPGIEFVALVFALLRAGVTIVLIDPGLGRRNLVRCLSEAEPDGFVAIGVAQAVRVILRGKFPRAKWNVTVGRRWFWGGITLDELRRRGDKAVGIRLPETLAEDAAAIIFTSGSTGPPKGVLYTQRMFDTQVAEIQSMYGIQPGGMDLSCFPLFALFNSAMGVTTVLPEMDFSRPASADPEKLLAAANDWRVTQAFASPAVWRKLSDYCEQTGRRIDSLTQVFSCGAPVPADVLRKTLQCVGPGAKMHTPYGATECLPVATIEAAEVLGETATRTNEGAGVCVGRRFNSIEWLVIRISDELIETILATEEMPVDEIGELIVRGLQASPCYVTLTELNAVAKISDLDGEWHRVGDVGYVDELGRFWYCGRKSQRVETQAGPLYTECVESLINAHPAVCRSALIGVGPRGEQSPVVICQPTPEVAWCGGRQVSKHADQRLVRELCELAQQHPLTRSIQHFLLKDSFPVDVRHNAKINREQLAGWAAKKLPELA